jgi:hypothetical protein
VAEAEGKLRQALRLAQCTGLAVGIDRRLVRAEGLVGHHVAVPSVGGNYNAMVELPLWAGDPCWPMRGLIWTISRSISRVSFSR